MAFSSTHRIVRQRHPLYSHVETTTTVHAVETTTQLSNASLSSKQEENHNPKVERKAAQRFAVAYDKLCKTCPTRLTPRVDTLTEMIMGLSKTAREELLQNVAKRCAAESEPQHGTTTATGVQTSRELYEFQVKCMNRVVKKNDQATKSPVGSTTTTAAEPPTTVARPSKPKTDKISKLRTKLVKNEQKLVQVQRLLQIATLHAEQGVDAPIPKQMEQDNAVDDDAQELLAQEIAELRALSPSLLELQRLKLVEQEAKCKRKIAESRNKLFAASLSGGYKKCTF